MYNCAIIQTGDIEQPESRVFPLDVFKKSLLETLPVGSSLLITGITSTSLSAFKLRHNIHLFANQTYSTYASLVKNIVKQSIQTPTPEDSALNFSPQQKNYCTIKLLDPTHLIKGSCKCWLKKFRISLSDCVSTANLLSKNVVIFIIILLVALMQNPVLWIPTAAAWGSIGPFASQSATQTAAVVRKYCMCVCLSMAPSICFSVIHRGVLCDVCCLRRGLILDWNTGPQSRITLWEGTCGPFKPPTSLQGRSEEPREKHKASAVRLNPAQS